jgi:hypothetical protein
LVVCGCQAHVTSLTGISLDALPIEVRASDGGHELGRTLWVVALTALGPHCA